MKDTLLSPDGSQLPLRDSVVLSLSEEHQVPHLVPTGVYRPPTFPFGARPTVPRIPHLASRISYPVSRIPHHPRVILRSAEPGTVVSTHDPA